MAVLVGAGVAAQEAAAGVVEVVEVVREAERAEVRAGQALAPPRG